MPSRFCPICREVVPSAEFEHHKRTVHVRRRLPKRIKAKIAERDGYRCKVCGSTERLEVHHRDDNPQNDDEANLELRCTAHNPRGNTFWYVDD
jgi:hypothetical protein